MFSLKSLLRFPAISSAATVAAVLAFAPAAQALNIYVDQDATWRYINASAATTQAVDPNWFGYSYNDSGWFTGQAPFTNVPTNPGATFGADQANVNNPYDPGTAPAIPGTGTQWDVNADPYMRIEFNLVSQTDLTVWLAVDNGINSMYLNGVQSTGTINAEGQAFRWEHVFDIDASYTVAGRNVLALQLEDHGGDTAFTLVVSSDDETDNPDFSTNAPAAIPAPGVVFILGLGLLVVGGTRRVLK